jgi:hypothetical protein
MRAPPRDPLAQQAAVFGALCEDLFDMAAGRSKRADRFNAMIAVRQATKERR